MAFPRVGVVDATRAEPAPFGILSPAVTVVESGDDHHWTSGFDYESLDCGTSVRLSSLCSTASGVTSIGAEDGTSAGRFRGYYPFNITVEYKCSTMGSNQEIYEKILADRMVACQQKAIEREFWTGALAKQEAAARGDSSFPNRYLASTAADDVTPTQGTAVKPKFGLALLEQALADCGCGVRGTIHATRGVASSLGQTGSDGALTTALGNYFVAGAGYTGTGPTGANPSGTQAWMYATGPLTVRLGSVLPRADYKRSIDRSTNTVLLQADRAAAVTFDSCCHYAVLVDLALDYS